MTCARCEHFSIKDHPDQAARGRGDCNGYLESLQDFRDWDDPECRLYRRAKQMEPRERWIAVQEARIAAEHQGADGAAASPAAHHDQNAGAQLPSPGPIENNSSKRAT